MFWGIAKFLASHLKSGSLLNIWKRSVDS